MNLNTLIEYYLNNISLLYKTLKNKEYKIYIASVIVYIPMLVVAIYYFISNKILYSFACIFICGICAVIMYEMVYRINVKINNEIEKRYYFKAVINRKNHFRFDKIYFFLEQKELNKYLKRHNINNYQEKENIVGLLKRRVQNRKIVITGVVSALIIPGFSKCIADLTSKQEGFKNQMLFLVIVLIAIIMAIAGIGLLSYIFKGLKNILVTSKKYCINQLIYNMQEIIVLEEYSPTN